MRIKRLDETRAKALQQADELAMMYVELKRMSGLILSNMRAPINRIDECSHDAASNLVAQYLKHPGYKVRSFTTRLTYECQAALANRDLIPNSRNTAQTVSLDETSIMVSRNQPVCRPYFSFFKGYAKSTVQSKRGL